ncbi:hypothetical protein M9H77_12214 [Catharanthus roseus]|uniref:Uncharacterized protein n=1 Tax=Catharanthus roseus TaxID=4058 RepID=A0ACC0BGU9_CATRO|nr:hypothetical protein M9H77_12214 [Catharanthus roseus]
MAGEQSIRPRRSLALGHDDHILSPLVRTKYSFPRSSSTGTSFATPATLSMEDIDQGIEEGSKRKHNAEEKGSSGSDLEVVEVISGTVHVREEKGLEQLQRELHLKKISAKKT